jgi:Mrp family chromosome partitioning ATPase
MLRKTKEKQEPIFTPVDLLWTEQPSSVPSAIINHQIRSMLEPGFLATFEALYDYLRLGSLTSTPRIVLSSAANSGEGSTTVAAGLAIVASKRKANTVLLVDANEHDRKICRVFNFADRTDQMACGAGIKETPIDRLSVSVLPVRDSMECAGPESNSIKPFIYEVLRSFSLVVIDAPPIYFSKEAILCAPYADVVAWVHNKHVTSSLLLERALSQLPLDMNDKVKIVSNHRKQECSFSRAEFGAALSAND